jgi:predicted nucleic acid-binding protein
MNRLVVADAGPLIALARLGSLALLPGLFSQALITPQVLAECEARHDRNEGAAIRAAISTGSLRLQAPPTPLPGWGVDPGESSAIALALQTGAGVLMDDRAGRNVARTLGLDVIGTAGLLVLAKRRGQISAVRGHLEFLVDSGYFLGPQVVAEVLGLAGE